MRSASTQGGEGVSTGPGGSAGAPMPDFGGERAEAEARFGAETGGEHVRPRRRSRALTAASILIGINVAVFLLMTVLGVSPTSPTPRQLVHFGAMDPELILFHGQWYRLLLATFVHVGVIHIATNMWCLYNLGLLGEPLLGRWGLLAVYLVTGIAGNLLSLAVSLGNAIFRHDPSGLFSVGAGASGAVFGIAGILIVLLSNAQLPIAGVERMRLRRSVIQFAGLNLLIGLGTVLVPLIRIDNMAHLGGFLSGIALGPALVPKMTSGRGQYLARQKATFAVAALLLMLFGFWISKVR